MPADRPMKRDDQWKKKSYNQRKRGRVKRDQSKQWLAKEVIAASPIHMIMHTCLMLKAISNPTSRLKEKAWQKMTSCSAYVWWHLETSLPCFSGLEARKSVKSMRYYATSNGTIVRPKLWLFTIRYRLWCLAGTLAAAIFIIAYSCCKVNKRRRPTLMTRIYRFAPYA